MGVVSSPCPPYAWGSAKVVGAWSQRYLGERGTHGPERGWGGQHPGFAWVWLTSPCSPF